MNAPNAIATWFRQESDEDHMHEDHAYLWRHMIASMRETDLRTATVLDYGCNRGGFLRELYQTHPYQRGMGVDIAQSSLAIARQRSQGLPLSFDAPEILAKHADEFDFAFSHEVIYLLPDLAAHGRDMASVLKPNGIYYAAIGCHTENPQWSMWRNLIAQESNLPVFDYSLNDYANALWNSGFRVEMRPFQIQDFVLIKKNSAYFPLASDSLNYHSNIKTIIRAHKVA